MGSKRQKHAAKVLARSEQAREVVADKGVSALKHMPMNKQANIATDAYDKLEPEVKGRAQRKLEEKARENMRKGADILVRRGKELTVALLLKDYYNNRVVQSMCRTYGLDETWFIALAEKEIESRGISV